MASRIRVAYEARGYGDLLSGLVDGLGRTRRAYVYWLVRTLKRFLRAALMSCQKFIVGVAGEDLECQARTSQDLTLGLKSAEGKECTSRSPLFAQISGASLSVAFFGGADHKMPSSAISEHKSAMEDLPSNDGDG